MQPQQQQEQQQQRWQQAVAAGSGGGGPAITTLGSSSCSFFTGRPTTAGRTTGMPLPPSMLARLTAAWVVGLRLAATTARARALAEARGGEAGSSCSLGT